MYTLDYGATLKRSKVKSSFILSFMNIKHEWLSTVGRCESKRENLFISANDLLKMAAARFFNLDKSKNSPAGRGSADMDSSGLVKNQSCMWLVPK